MMEFATIASATAAAGLLAGGVSRLAFAGWQRANDQFNQVRFRGHLQAICSNRPSALVWPVKRIGQSTQSNASPWRVMQVVEIADESVDVRSFYLQDPLQVAALPNVSRWSVSDCASRFGWG